MLKMEGDRKHHCLTTTVVLNYSPIVTGRFGPNLVLNPGRFGPVSFRSGRFGQGFMGGSFWPNCDESFRPTLFYIVL